MAENQDLKVGQSMLDDLIKQLDGRRYGVKSLHFASQLTWGHK